MAKTKEQWREVSVEIKQYEHAVEEIVRYIENLEVPVSLFNRMGNVAANARQLHASLGYLFSEIPRT